MFEYLKRKLNRMERLNLKVCQHPQYYEENGKLVKELATGEKWIVRLDKNYKEVLVERIK